MMNTPAWEVSKGMTLACEKPPAILNPAVSAVVPITNLNAFTPPCCHVVGAFILRMLALIGIRFG